MWKKIQNWKDLIFLNFFVLFCFQFGIFFIFEESLMSITLSVFYFVIFSFFLFNFYNFFFLFKAFRSLFYFFLFYFCVFFYFFKDLNVFVRDIDYLEDLKGDYISFENKLKIFVIEKNATKGFSSFL